MDPELQARLDGLLTEIQTANTKLDQLLDSPPEGGEDTSAAKTWKAAVEAARVEIGSLEKKFEALRERAERQKKVASMRASFTVVSPGEGRLTGPDQGGQVKLEAKPELPKLPASVRRFRPQNFRGEVDGVSAQERAYNFGCWAMMAMGLQTKGFSNFLQSEHVQRYMAASPHASMDAYGSGLLIPVEIANEMIDLRTKYGIVRSLFRPTTMVSRTKKVPKNLSSVTANWRQEGGTIQRSHAQLGMLTVEAKSLDTIIVMSKELVDDTPEALGDFFSGEIARALAYAEDNAGFNGDGTSTYGGVQGVLYRLKFVDGTSASAGLVTGAGNAWSELTIANFHSVLGKVPQVARQNANWVTSYTFYETVMVPLMVANFYVSKDEVGPDGKFSPRFLGRPVQFAEVMPATEANSQVCAVLGDFQAGAYFADRQTDYVEFDDRSTVGTVNLWETNSMAVKGGERIDMNIHGVGSTTEAGPIVGLITAGS